MTGAKNTKLDLRDDFCNMFDLTDHAYDWWKEHTPNRTPGNMRTDSSREPLAFNCGAVELRVEYLTEDTLPAGILMCAATGFSLVVCTVNQYQWEDKKEWMLKLGFKEPTDWVVNTNSGVKIAVVPFYIPPEWKNRNEENEDDDWDLD